MTFAPITTAPDGSLTKPEIVPRSDWARRGAEPGIRHNATKANVARKNDRFNIRITPQNKVEAGKTHHKLLRKHNWPAILTPAKPGREIVRAGPRYRNVSA